MTSKKQIHNICWKALHHGAYALYPDELERLAVHEIRMSHIPNHVHHLNPVQENIIANKVAQMSRKGFVENET